MNATTQQIAARRYRIERYLTEGGMGAIYVGKKLGPGGFEKDVVLKQLLPEYTSRPEFRDLFFREAKISATLDHANIVHTFDLVESDESLFIVMEYVRGADLRTICRRAKLRRRPISAAAAIQVALEVLAGLAYAHARRDPSGTSLGIIHRDVSPSNILCSAQGEVKLSDFGIAKASTHSSVFYRVRGKIGYMSPEQARSQPIDSRTDLYSLAVCLYEALTAERLFVGDLSTPADVIYGQPIEPLSHKREGLPTALDDVMAQALAPRPDDRYQDARSFAEALRQVAHHYGLLSSAPQLAEDLREILGADPNRWLQEDSDTFGAPETQKIQPKALEGREASSIGVVEGSNLYVVSGGDMVSATETPSSSSSSAEPTPDFDIDSLLREGPPLDKTRKPPRPAAAASDSPFFIPIDEDDEPTGARLLPRPSPTARMAATAAATTATATAAPRRPPTGPGAPPPLPPPPPRAALQISHPASLDSPFEDETEEEFVDEDELPMTPPPPRGAPPPRAAPPRGGPPRGAPYATQPLPPQLPPPRPYAAAPAFLPAPVPAPENLPLAPPAFNFRPPETIDFGSTAPAVVAKRSGPPGLVVLIVLLGAAAGGAKLGQLATRADGHGQGPLDLQAELGAAFGAAKSSATPAAPSSPSSPSPSSPPPAPGAKAP
jgi:serine/threonine protein kinase